MAVGASIAPWVPPEYDPNLNPQVRFHSHKFKISSKKMYLRLAVWLRLRIGLKSDFK